MSNSLWTRLAFVPLVIAASALLGGAASSGAASSARTLVPVGGDYSGDSLEGFARVAAEHASGPTIDILVVPAAYGTTPSIGQNTQLAQKRTDQIGDACRAVVFEYPGLSGCSATLLPIFTRADAQNPAYAARFDDLSVDAGFFLGGDQDLAMETMAGTALESAISAAYRRGVVFGGTSAGDAVESRDMISASQMLAPRRTSRARIGTCLVGRRLRPGARSQLRLDANDSRPALLPDGPFRATA